MKRSAFALLSLSLYACNSASSYYVATLAAAASMSGTEIGSPGGQARLDITAGTTRSGDVSSKQLSTDHAGASGVPVSRLDHDSRGADTDAGGLDADAAFSAARRPIYAADWGEKCDGKTDNASAYTAAIADAVAQGRSIEFGAGICLVRSTVPINGFLPDFAGKGEGVTQFQGRNLNGPIFHWNIGSQTIQHFRIHDFTASAYFDAGAAAAAAATATTAVLVTGAAASMFQHGAFDSITTQGLFAGITIAPTGFNKAQPADWLHFSKITAEDGQAPGQYEIYFPAGSGTGNTFDRMYTFQTGNPTPYVNGGVTYNGSTPGAVAVPGPAMLRFEGPSSGSLVGDQVITEAHTANIHALISVGANLGYRSNMSVTSSQADARTANVMDLPDDTVLGVFGNLHITGNNIGGQTAVNLPPVQYSTIDGQNVSAQRSGLKAPRTGFSTGSAARPQIVPLWRINGGHVANYWIGTHCTATVSGLVGNVGGGSTTVSFELGSGTTPGVGYTTAVAGAPLSSFSSASFFALKATASGGNVTISAAFTSSGASAIEDAQIECKAGVFSITPLL